MPEWPLLPQTLRDRPAMSLSHPIRSTSKSRLRRPALSLRCEQLEERAVPTVDLTPIGDFDSSAGKDLLVPVSATDGNGDPITYTATSNNDEVEVSLLTGGRSLRLNVSGTNASGNPFTGDLTLRLFEDLAPIATGRIIDLTESGFYDDLTFHRIIDDFVAQGGDPNGDGTGGSDLPDFIDEFDASLTFNSPGLLAMANSGDDTNNSQFFIVDTDLALEDLPQFLNFNHTIFGVLTSGFDIFEQMITTPTAPNDRPNDPVTINDASIFTDTQNGVLRVRPDTGFTGQANITVTGDDGTGVSNPEIFSVNVVTDTVNDRAFLNSAVGDLTTPVGTAVSFSIPGEDLDGDTLTYVVRDPANFANPPSNATVNLDQDTGLVTIQPDAGFTGTIEVLIGVRDDTNRGGGSLDSQSQFDTDVITISVEGNIDLDPDSDGGILDDDNVTDNPTPSLTIRAAAGETVEVSVNGGNPIPTAEVNPGEYSVTLAEGSLQVGANTISATAGTTELTPLTLTYAPGLRELFTVPGELGASQSLTFTFDNREAAFDSEIGLFIVDNTEGVSNGVISPGDPAYAQSALTDETQQRLFGPGDSVGDSTTLTFEGGQILGFYMIPNGTLEEWLQTNPDNAREGELVALFSLVPPNPDGLRHVLVNDDPLGSRATYAWEDVLDGGDSDYNDMVFSVSVEGPVEQGIYTVPLPSGREVTTVFDLLPASKSRAGGETSPPSTEIDGEVGLFFVEDVEGTVAGLLPSDTGYLTIALAPDNRRTIFSPGATVPTLNTLNLGSDGNLFGFYYVPGGTIEALRDENPGNDPANDLVGFFSIDSLNPDGVTHARPFGAELVTRAEPDPNGPTFVYMMGTLNGTADDFDDVVFSYTADPTTN